MNLAQLHYTSAPPGPDGSGFRFTAVSPGVPVSLLREAELLIGYEPPRDAPPRPDPAQLGAFPEALSLSVLSDGSRLLARAVYTGADYSGRWGNFHAHAVHLPGAEGAAQDGDGAAQDGDGPGRPAAVGRLPITAWGSPQWAAESPPPGTPLPPLASVPAPGPVDRAALAEFVAARGPWLAGFFADVRRLGEDAAAPQIVLVESDSGAVARWILLACSVLPHRRGQWLTFTTYTRRPQLARQQIVGVVPEDGLALAGQEHRYRVYDAARAAAPAPAADAWARTAALVWLAQREELFAEVRRLSAAAYEAGPLAALALAAGVGLDSAGRTAAADWAAGHPDSLDGVRLHALAAALGGPAADRGPQEAAACARLLAALAGRVPAAVSEPLAALALAWAVRHGGTAPPAGLLGEAARLRLAAELGPELRAALTDPGRDPAERVGLLQVAAELGVATTDLLPDLARHLAAALLADPEAAYTGAVREALAAAPEQPVPGQQAGRAGPWDQAGPARDAGPWEQAVRTRPANQAEPTEQLWYQAGSAGQPSQAGPRDQAAQAAQAGLVGRVGPQAESAGAWGRAGPTESAAAGAQAGPAGLRELVFERLDRLAVGDPAAAARVFALTRLRPGGAAVLPHLRMCAQPPASGGDRVRALTGLVAVAGVPLEADPLVLRTAMRLVWGGEPPAAAEAWLVLSTTGPAPHREAGTWELLVRAAVDSPADDRAAEDLAPELLRHFAAELPAGLRPSLLMLELAGNLRAGVAGPGWVRQALDLATLDPVPAAREHAFAAVGARLLAQERPESELRALIESNDAALLAAYRRAAREPRVVDRLRFNARYTAECFATWSQQPQAGPVWQEARADLLDGVLRPVVRGLPPADLTAVEEALDRLGGRWAQEFRAWQRPQGAFGRLRDRFAAPRRAKPAAPAPPPPPRSSPAGPLTAPEAPAAPPGTGSPGTGTPGFEGGGADGREGWPR
ncbi:GTPase-associated protein 1-related protein [Streptomyces sp. NPDC046876]|uniref:GTPase-associated protein 1-related protein n=1 Tax=Streptomyces sp. NPDC046876 TaxID=3155616 RepID=UPI003406B3AD